jgi:hypothetical protein
MATTARRRVFETVEILEIIILSLPRSDILANAQRISRTWKNTITQSPTIQRYLGMRPDVDRAVSPLDFVRTHTRHSPQASVSEPPDLPLYPYNIVLNRCIHDRVLGHVWQRSRSGTTKNHSSYTIILPDFNFVQTSSADFRPTWLGLFLTVPRITVAYLKLELVRTLEKQGDGPFYDSWSCASVRDPGDLTFETV